MDIQSYIVSIDTQPAIAIRRQAKMSKFSQVLGSVFSRTRAYMEGKGVNPSGAPFVQYYNLNWEEIATKNPFLYTLKNFNRVHDFYAGIPVVEELESLDDIESFSFPAGKYLEFEHRGSYMGIGKTYKIYAAAAIEGGVQLKSESIEFYLNAPGQVPTRELRTTIRIPLST